ncbi:MAG: NifU family protein [Myxococcota bacterium]|nr:NifU family protein [Myxococcota bacterium]
MELGFRMHAERTPNPNSIKWVLGRPIVEGGVSVHFDAAPASQVSPLAARLFEIDGVIVVFLAANFVTVTKRDDVEWTDLAQPIVDVLKEVLGGGGEPLGPAFDPGEATAASEVVARIRRVLDEEVRPAVAMDGGDVVFAAFREGIVEVYLQGSCSGCPSSSATLQHGIEARLREAIPEVQGVVAL